MVEPPPPSQQWIDDCLQWRGVVLSGIYSHWCPDWDGLPIDETCENEWPCPCKEAIDAEIASGGWFKDLREGAERHG